MTITPELALTILLAGLAAGALTALTRALPWPKAWKARKPLGCPACLSAWCSLAVLVYAINLGVLPRMFPWWLLPCWMAITGVALIVVGVAGVFNGLDALLDGGGE